MDPREEAIQAMMDANRHAGKGRANDAILSAVLANTFLTQHLIDKVGELERKLNES